MIEWTSKTVQVYGKHVRYQGREDHKGKDPVVAGDDILRTQDRILKEGLDGMRCTNCSIQTTHYYYGIRATYTVYLIKSEEA